MSSLADLPWPLQVDFVSLLEADFFSMNAATCTNSALYKYLSFSDPIARATYFSGPTIKFATKAELNDPFDLSRRFDQFGAELLRKFMTKAVSQRLDSELADVDAIVNRMTGLPQFAASGLSRHQLLSMLETPLGQAAIDNIREQMRGQLPTLIEMAFDYADKHVDEFMAGPIANTGVLSLSEIPDNRALWSVYANSGYGFALELDAQHPFFTVHRNDGTTRNRLMKVAYRDERIPDFWTNPYYLFAVKHSDFAFEREWRLISSLDRCEATSLPDGSKIYTTEAPRGLISAIIFGYRWKDADVDREGAILQSFDPAIELKRAVPNERTGTYDISLC